MSIIPKKYTKDFKEKREEIYSRIDEIVKLSDTKPKFFNNIFFSEKEEDIPMNLYNINYNSQTNEIIEPSINESYLNIFKFEEPYKIFELPSSDDSGDEGRNSQIPSFSKVCNDIIDFDTFIPIDKEEDLPHNVRPIVFFRGDDNINSMDKVKNFIGNYVGKEPYEIKIMQIFSKKQNKLTLTFIIEFYTLADAKQMKESLTNYYQIESRISYDRRYLNNSKWYCVVFRRDIKYEQKLRKFCPLIVEIYESIPSKPNEINKSFICTSVESTCEAKINENECIRKLGDVLYCAIKVSSLEQALFLCVKHNGTYDMKVNLHLLSYKIKKNEIPQVLMQKDEGNEQFKGKKNKKYEEDAVYQNSAMKALFPNNPLLLARKHKRFKKKKTVPPPK